MRSEETGSNTYAIIDVMRGYPNESRNHEKHIQKPRYEADLQGCKS